MKIIKCGLLTLIEDQGRFLHQAEGVTPGGPMDPFSFRLANILVDNDENAAALEITLMGPEILFTEDCVAAVTGADVSPELNGIPFSMNTAVTVRCGDTLSFGNAKGGLRAYVAFSGGGIDAPVMMGSRSVCVRLKFGRKLEAGDELKLMRCVPELPNMLSRCAPFSVGCAEGASDRRSSFAASSGSAASSGFAASSLRVIMGPQDHMFTDEGIRTFLSSEYKVTGQCDRMALRLEGDVIEHKDGADIISDGIANGAIQVPGNGQPMIMACERQTTGGYTKIAAVITADMGKLGQLKPGDRVRFEKVSLEDARALLFAHRRELDELKVKLAAAPLFPEKTYTVSVNGRSYGVRIRREG